ncbi:MAG: signal peptidase I [Bacteroidota bacterium]
MTNPSLKRVPVKQKNALQGHKEQVKDFLKDLVFVLVAFFFLNSFVIASFEVPTVSMENEIMTGDFLFVNKFIYGGTTPRVVPFTNLRIPWIRLPAFRDVHRQDVIVFEFPGQRDEVQSPEFMFYLKRCVAVAGDTVQIINRVLMVDGKPAPIPRNMKFNTYRIQPPGLADPRIFPPGASFNEDNWGPMVVPKKGDLITLTPENVRRWKTFIEREGHAMTYDNGRVTIDGIPSASYTVERNYVMGMGDNRDNSLDSRFWGFVPTDNIVGTPLIVYWSWDPDTPIYDIVGKLRSIRLGRIGTLIQ